MKSFTKSGDIYMPSCDFNRDLFPANLPPQQWSSCDDAYDFTWSKDFGGDLAGLSLYDRLKLSRSMGFCPHKRCQLFNVSSAGEDGRCPHSLCYTKIENGARSYGACCFLEGTFNAGQLIGFYNKTQATAKPIYKKSRVVLKRENRKEDEEDYLSFINANVLYPGMIATQCPMESTVGDVRRMIVEQNISLWIQLAPFWNSNKTISYQHNSDLKPTCQVFPNGYLTSPTISPNSPIFSSFRNFRNLSREETGFISESFLVQTFEIPYFYKTINGKKVIRFEEVFISNANEEKRLNVDIEQSRKLKNDVSEAANVKESLSLEDLSSHRRDLREFGEGDMLNRHILVEESSFKEKEKDIEENNNFERNFQIIEDGNDNVYHIVNFKNGTKVQDLNSNSIDGEIDSLRQNSTNLSEQRATSSESQTENETKKDNQTENETENEGWIESSFAMEHVWYHNWEDFKVPASTDSKDISLLAEKAAKIISSGGTTAVSCLSGRGRTGTFSAIVGVKLEQIRSHTELVDFIVKMREQRDGVVETPQQYRFISMVSGLRDPAYCSSLCRFRQSVETNNSTGHLFVLLIFVSFLILLPVL